jgi:hypothetical protein
MEEKMNKKLRVAALTLGVAALLSLSLGATVLAKNQPDFAAVQNQSAGCPIYGVNASGTTCAQTLTDLLGLTPEELCDLRQQGYSLADIAAEQGISLEELVAVVIDSRMDDIQAAVDSGTITQEQADLILERMTDRVEYMLTRDLGPRNGRAAGLEDGMFRGNGIKQGAAIGDAAPGTNPNPGTCIYTDGEPLGKQHRGGR